MNDGLVNEECLRNYINTKKFEDYNSNIQSFLKFVFKDCFNSSMDFYAEKKGGQVKPDLSINHNDVERFISVKKGSGNSVHQEKISVFFPFIENLCGTNTLNCLKRFHYGDDTIDDTGLKRYNATECKEIYSNDIKILNNDFNQKNNLKVFLERFLFKGNVGNIIVDVVYHGTIDNGLWATRQEILNYVINNDISINAVHFGPLTYQVWGRNEKGTASHPERRYVMQVKWGSITDDLKKIRS